MRKRSRIALAMVAVVCLGAFAWLVVGRGEREPVYQGKPLSYWLEGYSAVPSTAVPQSEAVERVRAANRQANEAVQHAGTNAIPTLLRMLRAKDSPLTDKLIRLARKQQLVKIHYISPSARNFQTYVAFGVVGATASNAVPEIIRIYEERVSETSQAMALRTLPVFNEESSLWVPILVKALQDPSPYVRLHALVALEISGSAARQAVPALIESLRDPDRNLRSTASNVLKRVDPEAAAKAGVK